MDPLHLRMLRELGIRGSVAAVAAAHHVSASAVSQQLSLLQARSPVPLTARRGRVLVLTPAGEALAAAGVRVEEALVAAREAVGAFVDDRNRPVRVSAFHSAGRMLFGPLLRALAPGPTLHLTDADVAHRDFPALTLDHDVVVAHRLAHDEAWPRDRVVAAPLLVEPLAVAMSAAHPLATRERLSAGDVAAEPWVSVHEGFPLAGVIAHVGAVAGRPPRILHRINDFSVTAEVLRAGDAIAIMPSVAAQPLVGEDLVLRRLDDVDLVRHVDALARPDALASAAVRRTLEALVDVAARVPRATP
ncbi:LysR family transcriptional regulator substrate-binding protein [Agrococcus sp. SGAir0287]|uniref:LysR family transcriptional regulator substrate-binding protein n=1 Tax=Agrococcus sp. SGAir0287 TaxID=2070347 RepID=UPI0010CD15AD|nr:LysR family transcriptional regulator substrate-binding protein [Agrococcus sp. SGAir0287]QCR19368.1 LysR family transcriptional regulator [Agrococcus sp. SGAir0287]